VGWSRRRNPPFADDKDAVTAVDLKAGYAFGSNLPYELLNCFDVQAHSAARSRAMPGSREVSEGIMGIK
jgi:hypothetical protein